MRLLQNRSLVQVVDNTEVLEIRCFRDGWGLGDLVTGSVTKVSSGKAGSKNQPLEGRGFKRGDVVRAVIIGCRGKTRRPSNGRRMSCGTNTCVLRTNAGKEGWVPVGTRVMSAVPRSLRLKGWGNVVSLGI